MLLGECRNIKPYHCAERRTVKETVDKSDSLVYDQMKRELSVIVDFECCPCTQLRSGRNQTYKPPDLQALKRITVVTEL